MNPENQNKISIRRQIYKRENMNQETEKEIMKILAEEYEYNLEAPDSVIDEIISTIIGYMGKEEIKESVLEIQENVIDIQIGVGDERKEEDERCPICMDIIEKKGVITLKCGHQIHNDCYWQMITCGDGFNWSKPKCPMCRTEMTEIPDSIGMVLQEMAGAQDRLNQQNRIRARRIEIRRIRDEADRRIRELNGNSAPAGSNADRPNRNVGGRAVPMAVAPNSPDSDSESESDSDDIPAPSVAIVRAAIVANVNPAPPGNNMGCKWWILRLMPTGAQYTSAMIITMVNNPVHNIGRTWTVGSIRWYIGKMVSADRTLTRVSRGVYRKV